MNILVICQYFYPESFRINDIASEWIKRGHKVNVVTGIPNYPEGRFYEGYSFAKNREEEYKGIHIHRLPIIPRGKTKIGIVLNYLSFMISGLVWSKFTKMTADVVFSFETSPMTQVLVGTCYARRTKTRHIVYVQDLWPENVEEVGGIRNPIVIKPLDRMVKYIYRNADLILATSPSFVEMIRKRMSGDKKVKNHFAKEKVVYWPQCAEDLYAPVVKKSVVEQISQDKEKIFKIVFTGNIGYAQGLDILPETARLLKDSGIDRNVKFVLVGDGRAKSSLVKTIDECGVSHMFEIIGRRQPEDIPKILSECDFAFLSFSNNKLFAATIPAKLQSYMACGMPILAAAIGESERILSEADCGICVLPGKPQLLYEAVKKLTNMPHEQVELMSSNSLVYYKQNFNRCSLMDKMEDFLQG